MYRLVRFLSALCLVALAAVGAYLWATRESLIERFLTERLKAKVSIESVDIGLKQIVLHGFQINNCSSPKGCAFESATLTIHLSPLELWKQTIPIHSIEINNAILNLELYNGSGIDNNWVRLLNKHSPTENHTFVIHHLLFNNLQFTATRSNGRPIPIASIPHLEFKNIGGKDPLSVGEIEQVLFCSILAKLTNQPYLNAILDNVEELPEELKGRLTPSLALEEDRGKFQEGLEAIRRKTQEATEFLQALFSK